METVTIRDPTHQKISPNDGSTRITFIPAEMRAITFDQLRVLAVKVNIERRFENDKCTI